MTGGQSVNIYKKRILQGLLLAVAANIIINIAIELPKVIASPKNQVSTAAELLATDQGVVQLPPPKAIKPNEMKMTKEYRNPVHTSINDIQQGEVLTTAIGDIDGDGSNEEILLMGNRFTANSNYDTDLYVIVRDERGKLKYYYRPTLGGGYNCSLQLADVNGDGAEDILIAAPTGGSGGIVDYRIIAFTNQEPREIFQAVDNEGVGVNATYLPDYKVALVFPKQAKEVLMNITTDKTLYEHLGVYNGIGELLQAYRKPYVQNISDLAAFDIDGDQVAELITTQKIVGITSSDILGYVRAVYKYNIANWEERDIVLQSKILTMNDNHKVITMDNGYSIVPRTLEMTNKKIVYPSFVNVTNLQAQWLMNETIAKYVQGLVTDESFVDADFVIKYAGEQYLSLVLQAKKINNGQSEVVTTACNFNLLTGQELRLDELFETDKDFWQIIDQNAKSKVSRNIKKGLKSFLFDGSKLVIIYNHDEKEEKGEFQFEIIKKKLKLN